MRTVVKHFRDVFWGHFLGLAPSLPQTCWWVRLGEGKGLGTLLSREGLACRELPTRPHGPMTYVIMRSFILHKLKKWYSTYVATR